MFFGIDNPGIPFLIELYPAGAIFHQSFRHPRSNMIFFPGFLFLTKKAKVGKFIVSWPLRTGWTKAQAGTIMSVVVLMIDTSTVESDAGRFKEGLSFG